MADAPCVPCGRTVQIGLASNRRPSAVSDDRDGGGCRSRGRRCARRKWWALLRGPLIGAATRPQLDQPVEGMRYPRSPGGLACARVRAIERGRRSRARPNPPPARHDRREGVGYALRSLPRACARARDRKVVVFGTGGRSARPGSRSRLGTRCPASTVGFEPRGCDRPGVRWWSGFS